MNNTNKKEVSSVEKLFLSLLGIIIIVLLAISAYNMFGKNEKTSIHFKVDSITMELNEALKLEVEDNNGNTIDDGLTWASNNTNVAIVDENGVLRSVSNGKTEIIVQNEKGDIAKCDVVVSLITPTEEINPTNTPEVTPYITNSPGNVTPTISPQVTATNVPTVTPTTKPTATAVALTNEKIHFIKQSSGNDLDPDLDNGDAILLESNGHYAMIDTGLNNATDNKYILNYLKKVGVKKLDFILLTHNHKDHVGGVACLMKNLEVARVYLKTYTGADSASKKRFNNIKSVANSKKVKLTYIEKSFKDGGSIKFQDMTIKLYNTSINSKITYHYDKNGKLTYSKVNENSNTVLELINVNGFKVFLTGDLYDEKNNIEYLTSLSKKSEFKNLDVLKLPHHGLVRSAFGGVKAGTYNKTAYKNFNPKYTVVTASKCNICKSIGATKNVYYSRKKTAVVFSFNGSVKVQYVS